MGWPKNLFILSLWVVSATMGKTSPADSFRACVDTLVSSEDRFAIGAAFTFGNEAPTFVVSGPVSVDQNVPVLADAPWHIGSITKSFTATLAMILVDEGRLDLDLEVGTYLTDYSTTMHPNWQRMTMRELLSHTAGLKANISLLRRFSRVESNAKRAALAEMQHQWRSPITQPKGKMRYSNLGYVLAGVILEEITGKDWETLVQERIAKPLGLNSLGFGPPMSNGAPWGHSTFLSMSSAIDPTSDSADNPAWMRAAGGIHMSVADLARWGQAHLVACDGLNPEFLSAQSCQQMQMVVADEYGLGWVIQQYEGNTIIWHNGSNTLWYAQLVIAPEQNLTIALTHNRQDALKVDHMLAELLGALGSSDQVGASSKTHCQP